MPNNKIAPATDAADAGGADRLRKRGGASDAVPPLRTDGAAADADASLAAALKQVDLDGDGALPQAHAHMSTRAPARATTNGGRRLPRASASRLQN